MNNLIEQYLDEFFKELQHTPGPWGTDGRNKQTHAIFTVIKGSVNLTRRGRHDIMYSNETVTANSKLISRAPDILRSLCRTYLTLLVKFAYGQNDFCTSARISLDDTLASLRNEISNATGLECQYLQDTFESYAFYISRDMDWKEYTTCERYLKKQITK